LSTDHRERRSGTTAAAPAGWDLRADAAGRLGVHDPACGRCAACVAGRRVACLEPTPAPVGPADPGEPGPDAGWRWRAGAGAYATRPDELRAAAVVDDLLRHDVPARPAVLVLGAGAIGRASALAALGAGAGAVALIAPPNPVDDAELRRTAPGVLGPLTDEAARERLAALSPSGRADVVIAADGDLARAARLVRRGGVIATVVPPLSRPTVTTIVQRELSLPSPRDLVQAALTCRLAGTRTTEGAEHGH
jgi:hypothetical protein